MLDISKYGIDIPAYKSRLAMISPDSVKVIVGESDSLA